MSHRLSGLSTYGLNGLDREMSLRSGGGAWSALPFLHSTPLAMGLLYTTNCQPVLCNIRVHVEIDISHEQMEHSTGVLKSWFGQRV